MGLFDFFCPRMTDAEAVADLSEKIVVLSLTCAKQLGGDHPRTMAVAVEFAYLFLHLIDRISFGELSDPRRASFMSLLVEATDDQWLNASLTDEGFSHRAEIKRAWLSGFSPRNIAYGMCREVIRREPPMGGTVTWEFSERVSSILGRDKDIIAVMEATSMTLNAMQAIDAQRTIKRLSR